MGRTLLVQKGADVRVRPRSGMSPLHLAIAGMGLNEYVSPELILLLVEKGADLQAPGRDGLTPLMLAALLPAPEFEPLVPGGR